VRRVRRRGDGSNAATRRRGDAGGCCREWGPDARPRRVQLGPGDVCSWIGGRVQLDRGTCVAGTGGRVWLEPGDVCGWDRRRTSACGLDECNKLGDV
jgi:hypothetical protein